MQIPKHKLLLFLILTLLFGFQNSHAQVCGNAILDGGESCDDGNMSNDDGCSETCQIETGYECSLPIPPVTVNGVDDGSFEDGTPNQFWTEASARFGTPLCDEDECGLGNGTGPRSGDWWAWFGGSASAETASLQQQLVIGNTDGELSFWLEVPRCDSAADFLSLTIDGNEVFRFTGDDALCGQIGYTRKTIDLASATGGPYNDDASHTLRFEAQTFSVSGDATNIFVDDVLIDQGLTPPTPSECSAFDSCFSEDFDPGTGSLPAAWTIFEQAPQNHNWGTTDDGECGSGPNGDPGNFTGGAGVAACVDSDAAGNTVDAYLCSESIDLTSATNSRLHFLYSYQVFQGGSDDIFDVLVGTAAPSAGNINTYANVLSTGGTSQGASFATPGVEENLDLTAFQGSAVHFCFHYGADDDFYAEVDDIEVRADSCDGSQPEPPKAPPTNVSATDGMFTDKVVVNWDDVSDETSYQVYRCSSADDTGSCSQIATPAGNVISQDDTGADVVGTVHYYRLKACNAVGCSAFSPSDAGNRLFIPPPPAVPNNVSASDASFADKVRITWNDVSSEDGYLLFRCSDGTNTGNCAQIATPVANVSSYDDINADTGGFVHHYRLKSCSDAGGCSAFSLADAGNRLQVCGDSTLGPQESCDDGNDQSGDGCSSSCQVEAGYECTLPVASSIINAVADGGFESGTPNPSWAEASLNFDTPLCDEAMCGSPAGGGPNTGDWWAWFGGGNDPETSSLEQVLQIEDSNNELGFWLKAQACDSSDDLLSLSIDGNELFLIRGDDESCGSNVYARHSIDLTTAPGGPYNDNTNHTLRFDAQTFRSSGSASSFFVDDVDINRGTTPPVASVCSAFETCYSEDFEPGTGSLPSGWTVFELASQEHNWGTTDDGICGSGPSGDASNFTGGTGVAACVDSDAAGSPVDAFLCTDAIDLSGVSGGRLRFLYNYQLFGSAGPDDLFDVMMGTAVPGAETIDSYSTIFSTGGTNQGMSFGLPGAEESLDISALNSSTAYFCFHYGAENDWYAQLDDIEVRAESCETVSPPPATPTGVNASDGTFTDKVVVNWSDVSGEDRFQLFRCTDTATDACSQITEPAANTTSYDDSGALADGTVHYYRLKACSDAGGCSGFSDTDAGHRQEVVLPDLVHEDGFEEPEL
jgi:cysteine-rich repeat protein